MMRVCLYLKNVDVGVIGARHRQRWKASWYCSLNCHQLSLRANNKNGGLKAAADRPGSVGSKPGDQQCDNRGQATIDSD